MLKRIVKMEFLPEKTEEFKQIFQANREMIKNFEGCHSITLLQDTHQSNIFFTYSLWDSQEKLDTYRNSALFTSVWKKTKLLFNRKPFAWSVQEIL